MQGENIPRSTDQLPVTSHSEQPQLQVQQGLLDHNAAVEAPTQWLTEFLLINLFLWLMENTFVMQLSNKHH